MESVVGSRGKSSSSSSFATLLLSSTSRFVRWAYFPGQKPPAKVLAGDLLCRLCAYLPGQNPGDKVFQSGSRGKSSSSLLSSTSRFVRWAYFPGQKPPAKVLAGDLFVVSLHTVLAKILRPKSWQEISFVVSLHTFLAKTLQTRSGWQEISFDVSVHT